MPYTPSPVAEHFALVLAYAKQQKKAELTALVEDIKTVNFIYNLERPIERLAFEGHDEAVTFLLINFDGNLDSAVRGYARANNKTAVEELLRSGASIHYAAMGYAMAENTDAKEQMEEGEGEENDPAADLLHRGAHRSWVSVGLARAGKEEALLAFHYREGDEDKSFSRMSLRLQHIFRGCALGRHVQVIDNLFVKFATVIERANNRDALRASIVRGYAQINDQVLLGHWLEPVSDSIKIALLEGYAEGGHLEEAKGVSTSHFANNGGGLARLLEKLAFGGHVNQAYAVSALGAARHGADLVQVNSYLLNGFVVANILSEVSAIMSKDTTKMAIIYAYLRNHKYFELEKLWNQYYTDSVKLQDNAYSMLPYEFAYFRNGKGTLAEKFITIFARIGLEKKYRYENTYPDRHYESFELDLRYLRAASNVRNDDFKNFLIRYLFSPLGCSHLVEAMEVITRNMHDKFLSFEESINLNIPRQMERYNLTANPLRVWRAYAKIAGQNQSVDCFTLFKNILPGLTNNFKVVPSITLLIAAYLLPKVCWNVVTLPDQVSLYQLGNLSFQDMIVLASQLGMFTIDRSKAIPAVTRIPPKEILTLYPYGYGRSRRAIERTMDKMLDTICSEVIPDNAITACSSSASMSLDGVVKVEHNSYTFRTNFRTELGRFFIHTKDAESLANKRRQEADALYWANAEADENCSDSEDSSVSNGSGSSDDEKVNEHRMSP